MIEINKPTVDMRHSYGVYKANHLNCKADNTETRQRLNAGATEPVTLVQVVTSNDCCSHPDTNWMQAQTSMPCAPNMGGREGGGVTAGKVTEEGSRCE